MDLTGSIMSLLQLRMDLTGSIMSLLQLRMDLNRSITSATVENGSDW